MQSSALPYCYLIFGVVNNIMLEQLCVTAPVAEFQGSHTIVHVIISNPRQMCYIQYIMLYMYTAVCSARMGNLAGYIMGQLVCKWLSGYVTGWPDALPVYMYCMCLTTIINTSIIFPHNNDN